MNVASLRGTKKLPVAKFKIKAKRNEAYDQVLAPFDAAAVQLKQKAAAPATTGDAIAQSGLAKKELATFCL